MILNIIINKITVMILAIFSKLNKKLMKYNKFLVNMEDVKFIKKKNKKNREMLFCQIQIQNKVILIFKHVNNLEKHNIQKWIKNYKNLKKSLTVLVFALN